MRTLTARTMSGRRLGTLRRGRPPPLGQLSRHTVPILMGQRQQGDGLPSRGPAPGSWLIKGPPLGTPGAFGLSDPASEDEAPVIW